MGINLQQIPDGRLSILDDLGEVAGSMAEFEDADLRVRVREKFVLDLFQDLKNRVIKIDDRCAAKSSTNWFDPL